MPPSASMASNSPRDHGRHTPSQAPPLRARIAKTLLLLCMAFVCAESAPSSRQAASTSLVVHRRRECAVETLARTAFADVARLDAFFDHRSFASSDASDAPSVEWSRVDTCGGSTSPNCVSGENVALVDGKLSLAPVSRVSATITTQQQRNATTTRLRVHAAFPVNTSATATIALSLPNRATVVSLSVVGSRLRLAAPAHNWSVELTAPCAPLASANHIHVVDFEWTARWLRWHWDGQLLHEAKMPKAPRRLSQPLRVDLSLAGPSDANATGFHIKTLELQQVRPGQDDVVCRPHVRIPEANCRHHTRFEPRLGADQGYLSLAQVYDFVRSAPERFPSPNFTKLEEIGMSTQNRSLLALCVGACWRPDAPQVLFTGMHHSREPISMMNLVYTIDLLALDVVNGVIDTTALLMSRQLWFVLVVNPDGYARNEELQTWREQRSGQRKNARTGGCESTPSDGGVDLNRNYDVCFAEDDVGSSTDPCGEDYRGPAPFSEPETRAIKQFVERNGSHFAVSLNYHSFGRYFNVPYACKALDTPRGVNMTVFETWAQEMTRYNGFKYGQPWKDDNLYSVNGETSDWLWAKHGIFAMSPEVGPAFSTRVDQGFWPPREDVPALAVELHYSNIVAARLAGPQYNVLVKNVTRQLASQQDEDSNGTIRALLLVELAVQNQGLATAGDVEIVLATALVDNNATNAFTTTTSIPEAEVGTVRDGGEKPPVTRLLAIPETAAVHVVVRDALSCQYIRLTTFKASKNATSAKFQQWSALELPLCGFCGSVGREDAAKLNSTPVQQNASTVCQSVEDLVDPQVISVARVTRLKTVHTNIDTAEEEARDAKSTAPSTIVSASSKPVPTEATASPTSSTPSRAEDTEAPATTSLVTSGPPPSESTPPVTTTATATTTAPPADGENQASAASTTNNAGSSSFASFASVPVIATLFLVALVVFFVVVRRRRRASESSTKAATTKPGRRKNYVKVVNDEDEAAELEHDAVEDEDAAGDNSNSSTVRRNPRAGRRDDSDDEDAEYGRRRSPNASRPRGKSDDDELV